MNSELNFLRHLDETSSSDSGYKPWTNGGLRFFGVMTLAFSGLLLYQGYQRRRIVHVILPFFLLYLSRGNDLWDVKDIFEPEKLGLVHIIAGGGFLALIANQVEAFGYFLLGACAGGFASAILLLQILSGSASFGEFFAQNYDIPIVCGVFIGPILGCCFRECLAILFSAILGATLSIFSILAIFLGTGFYKTMNKYGFIFLVVEIGLGYASYRLQDYYKREEDKMIALMSPEEREKEEKPKTWLDALGEKIKAQETLKSTYG